MGLKTKIEGELATLLAASPEGTIKPADVVAFAIENKKSAIRTWMEGRGGFDPQRALAEYQMILARNLIRVVRVEIARPDEAKPIVIRAYESLGSDRATGGGYRSTQTVMTDIDLRKELLRTALGELAAIRRRYASLKELAGLFESIAVIEKQMADSAA